MVDIMTKRERSTRMSKIRGKNTKIEIALARELRQRKLSGFRRYPKMVGKPDFVFKDAKLVIFCDGDFWHGYRFAFWKHKLNYFWSKKISANIRRDNNVRRALEREGWRVMRFWEHQIEKDLDGCVDKIARQVVK